MNNLTLKFPLNSTFLVTGGAGFIGSNLCEAILAMGYNVRCLDNLSSGKLQYTQMFSYSPHYTFINGDVKDFNVCKKACENVDYVLHQAASSSVPQSIEKPLLFCEDNIIGTVNMLEAARQNQIKKFVYASSASVYGDEPSNFKVEGREGAVLSPYAVTKRSCEEWAKQYATHYGMDTYGLRYFNVYGRRQDPNGAYAAVIPKFIKQLLRMKQPLIFGDGGQSRDFVYIDDVVEANLRACLASHEIAGEVFNIAGGDIHSLLETYHIIASLLGVQLDPIFTSEREGDIRYSQADITKAKRMLHYMPKCDFIEGLKKTIEWYRANSLDNNNS